MPVGIFFYQRRLPTMPQSVAVKPYSGILFRGDQGWSGVVTEWPGQLQQ